MWDAGTAFGSAPARMTFRRRACIGAALTPCLHAMTETGDTGCRIFMADSVTAPVESEIPADGAAAPHAGRLWGLALGSIGVVYGDIGTSPLYAFREAIVAASPGGTDQLTAQRCSACSP